LSSIIPGVPSELDLTLDALCLAYLSDSRIPPIPVIYEKFPMLVDARIPPLNAGSSSIFIGALIGRLQVLEEVFNVDPTSVKLMLSAIIGEVNAVSVNIMMTNLKIGSFQGGSLEFMAIMSTPPVMRFTAFIYLDLPGAQQRAEMAISIAMADTVFLTGSLGPANGETSGPPVWPRPFGLPGLDVYYLGIGVGFKGPLPVAIAVAFKVGFRKTNQQQIILGGAVSLGAGQWSSHAPAGRQ
jgi:hypothetical protein